MSKTLFPPSIEYDALLSPCERYRFWLSRWWDKSLEPVVFVMLNPSTADAKVDDPTIRRCMGFARAWGAGGVVVVNLFAWRATNPAELVKAGDFATGLGNDIHILGQVREASRVIAAWGAHPFAFKRGREVAAMLRNYIPERPLECLGTTKGGSPRHPLYVRANTQPIPFAYPEAA